MLIDFEIASLQKRESEFLVAIGKSLKLVDEALGDLLIGNVGFAIRTFCCP